jgi:hypothetical protein
VVFLCQLCHSFGFLPRATRVLVEANYIFLGNSPLHQVVFYEFRDAGIRTKLSTAGYNFGGNTLAKELGSVSGAITIKVIVTQDDYGIRVCRGVIDNPGFRHESHDGMAHKIDQSTERYDKNEGDETGNDPSPFSFARVAALHLLCIRID